MHLMGTNFSLSLASKDLGAAETASEFFKRRAEGGSPEEFIRLLKQSPDKPPIPGDEIG
jgi:hypothetical protein